MLLAVVPPFFPHFFTSFLHPILQPIPSPISPIICSSPISFLHFISSSTHFFIWCTDPNASEVANLEAGLRLSPLSGVFWIRYASLLIGSSFLQICSSSSSSCVHQLCYSAFASFWIRSLSPLAF